ncbi:MAG: M20/M25/M40 family metallo-hydrolase [Dehalococcoidia bacterium]|nr:M20/M25/M40 family metallo-hydrolase [Chloroflexota bacterium]
MASPTAQKVLGAVSRDDMLSLAGELIKIPSFKTQETAVARFLGDFLGQRGYQVQPQEVEPGRFQTIAVLNGSGGGKSLMFNGHIDINPLAQEWKRDPWTPTVDGDRLYGAGIRNMKGGVAAMIEAAEAIRRSGVRLKGDLVLACVAGELQGGVGTSYLCEHGPLTDMAVVPEPFGADNVVTVHAGSAEMAIHTIGRARHMNRAEESIDAIEKMCKAIPVIKGIRFRHSPRPDLPGLPRVNVGTIIGGLGRDHDRSEATYNADFCTVVVDVRFPPGTTAAMMKEDVERALDGIKKEDPEFQYEIEMPPPAKYQAFTMIVEPFELPKDEYILDCVLRQYRTVAGKEPRGVGTVLPWSYSCDDTSKLLKAGVPCLLHGPAGGIESATVPDEYSVISDMHQVAKVLALTALDVCSLPK